MLDLLLAATLKGTALIVLVIVIQWIGRERIPAGWRYAMWLLVLLRLLMPVGPSASFSLFNLASADTTVFEVETSTGTAAITPLRVAGPAPAPEASPLPLALLAIWAAGFLAITTRYLIASIGLQRRVRSAERVSCSDAPLPLLQTDAVSSPALHGILRPKLLVPPGLLEHFDSDERRYIFLHEVAHLRRGDVFINCVAALVEAVHWFNPLVWLALARMREERELACDRAALALLSDEERTRYGRTILKLLDCFRTPASAPALVGMASRHDEMKRRIHMIAAFRKSPRITLAFSALIVALGFASLTDAQVPETEIIAEKQSPAVAAVMDKLSKRITLEMKEANAIDIAQAVANSAGVTLSLSPEATAEIASAPKISIKATDIPAHFALAETLHNAKLGMKFTETGVEISKEGTIRRFHLMHPGVEGEAGEAEHRAFFQLREETEIEIDGEKQVRTFVQHKDGEATDAATAEKKFVVKRIHPDGKEVNIGDIDILKELPEGMVEGTRVFVRHLGETEGRLEIEVHDRK